ncbi:hypothetical protein [Cellulomonas fengjieae]|uniref:hypothetical protein n=1 Tax=Cellulomonas fengjieae TaxID=2819978 RepID=UPI001AAE2456|nr:hypothetical protein [Cellulomonas fengjieae]MBO3103527.1 hypothetical protein [Cellulomonas fengjieae]
MDGRPVQDVPRLRQQAATAGYPWNRVAAAFVAVGAVLTVIVGLAHPHRMFADTNATLTGPAWRDGWFHDDAAWYLRIATRGYGYVPGEQSSIAFFPVFPMAVRALGALATAGRPVGVAVLVGWSRDGSSSGPPDLRGRRRAEAAPGVARNR